MSDHYYLNEDHTYTPCSLEEWREQLAEMAKSGTKHLGDDKINGYRISTIWMGMNHNYEGYDLPLLFETMVFDKDSASIYVDRYSTWNDALEGHEMAIKWVEDGCKEDE